MLPFICDLHVVHTVKFVCPSSMWAVCVFFLLFKLSTALAVSCAVIQIGDQNSTESQFDSHVRQLIVNVVTVAFTL